MQLLEIQEINWFTWKFLLDQWNNGKGIIIKFGFSPVTGKLAVPV